MASAFGHALSIIGIKKLFPDNKFKKKALILGIVSAVIPDIDFFSENFGIIANLDKFGFLAHRGFTHSILFALLWSIIILVIFHKSDKTNKVFLGLFYFICTLSHGLLDSMTNGGDGVSFFFPITYDRYFFPLRFIEVSPIGITSFFSDWGIEILISEFKYIGIPSLALFGLGCLLNKKIYK